MKFPADVQAKLDRQFGGGTSQHQRSKPSVMDFKPVKSSAISAISYDKS